MKKKKPLMTHNWRKRLAVCGAAEYGCVNCPAITLDPTGWFDPCWPVVRAESGVPEVRSSSGVPMRDQCREADGAVPLSEVPMTPADWRRVTWRLGVLCAAVWVLLGYWMIREVWGR